MKKKSIYFGYISQIFSIGSNLLILPFALQYLSTNELGLWYNFSILMALVFLLDFGLSATFTRNIAYVWNGFDEIPVNGMTEKLSSNVNEKFLSEVIYAGKTVYKYVSMTAFALLISFGSLYIWKITNNYFDILDVIPIWLLFISGVVLQFYFFYWTPLLRGIGAIDIYYQGNIVSKATQLVIAVLGLYFGYGLFSLVFSYFFSIIISRIYYSFSIKKFILSAGVRLDTLNIKHSPEKLSELLNAAKKSIIFQGGISLSNYMIDKVTLMFITLFVGLEASASYGVTVQAFTVISVLGNVIYNTLSPKIISYRVIGELDKANRMLTKSLKIQVIIIFIGSLSIIIFGQHILDLIGSNTNLLDSKTMYLMVLYYLIFNFQLVCTNYIIIGNEYPMFKAYIFSALIYCLTIYILGMVINLDVDDIVVFQLFFVIIYNGWKWPNYVAKKFFGGTRLFVDSFVENGK